MRLAALVAFFCAISTAPALAIPYFPPPTPVYEAPIDRALENVASTSGMSEAQREAVLGRFNLLAYARDDANFAYLQENNELNLAGAVPCGEASRGYLPPDRPLPTFAPGQKCAIFTMQLGPWQELPDTFATTFTEHAQARLEAAETHYARALQLEGGNLRARLGHAYVLDRLGRTDDARRELRRIISLGLPRVSRPQSDWEDYAVLTETATHLSYLATSSRDRRDIAKLRARLGSTQPIMYVTPIVVPLTDRAFESMVDRASPVAFDFSGTGDRRAQGWLTADAAWLVWDPNWRSDVRSGFDLVGARSWAVFWSDGFEALRALDDNHDGQLTGAELGGLALWRDLNGDGVSEADEVMPVEAHGIVSLATNGANTRPGLVTARSGVRFDNGTSRPLYDWTPGLDRGRAHLF